MFHHHENRDHGRVVLTDPPTDDLMSLSACKKMLGITTSSSDLVVTAALAAVAGNLDASTAGWLGRALRTQSWELQLHSFGHRYSHWRHPHPHAIQLPYPPLISVDSVKYLDINGNDTTLVLGTDYRVIGMGDVYRRQAIAPLYNGTWPVCRVDDASVRIQFTAGYDDDVNITPPQLLSAVALGVRAVMATAARDPLLWEDSVIGVGSKRYQNNPLMMNIIKDAIQSLLINLAMK